ncbi:MAG: hypothetical protein J6T41_01185, partial [Neisseriaceae bacterium]|nr:hypothetical protein [Neisseriaceae bacterium]
RCKETIEGIYKPYRYSEPYHFTFPIKFTDSKLKTNNDRMTLSGLYIVDPLLLYYERYNDLISLDFANKIGRNSQKR